MLAPLTLPPNLSEIIPGAKSRNLASSVAKKRGASVRIGVIGSWRSDTEDWKFEGTQDAFQSACRAIGKELARTRQRLIVGGESPRSADFQVVTGFLEIVGSARPGAPLIEVLEPNNDRRSYRSHATAHPGVFGFHLNPQSRWTETLMFTVREADSVIIVGGMGASYRAGLAAIVARKHLAPVGCFGGAASALSRDLRAIATPETVQDLLALNGPWEEGMIETVLRRAGIRRRPRIMLVHGHSSDRYELQSWLQNRDFCELVVMQQEFGDSRAFVEKFEQSALISDGAIILATPDDFAAASGGAAAGRARQNVWLEAGWFWGRLGRNRILLLLKGELEIPSDLAGVEYYAYRQAPSERGEELKIFAERLIGL